MSNAHELSNALFDTLKPTIEKVDRSVQNVYDSQTLLKDQLDHLEKVLAQFEDLQSITPLEDYVVKITETRNRIATVNAILARVNTRVNNIKDVIKKGQNGSYARQLKLSEDDMKLIE